MADNTGSDISTMAGAGWAEESDPKHTPKRGVRKGYHGMTDEGAMMHDSAEGPDHMIGSDLPPTWPTHTGHLSA